MKYVNIGGSELLGSTVALGCMRIAQLERSDLCRLLGAAIDAGINLFDHADIYGGGRCEEVFGEALQALPAKREDLLLQTKCGIRDGFFDFSKKHILASVDGSLARLRTDYLDLLLLHRPDALVEPDEVAAAFDELHAAGKVRGFGVSNQNPAQLELLRRHVRQPLLANQLQLSVAHTGMIDSGINVNMTTPGAHDRDGGSSTTAGSTRPRSKPGRSSNTARSKARSSTLASSPSSTGHSPRRPPASASRQGRSRSRGSCGIPRGCRRSWAQPIRTASRPWQPQPKSN